MNIIEKYKKDSSHVVEEYIQSLLDEEETSHPGQDHSQIKELIKQISENDPKQQQQQEIKDQEERQFRFFAQSNTTKTSKCIVCKKANPKYTCPKCKVQYCSIDHYKSHNLFCSQRFFKDQVENQLKATKVSKDAKKKMIQILKSNREQTEKDDNQLREQITVQDISEQRLRQLLEALENEEEVSLSQNETKAFQLYLKDLQYASLQSPESPNTAKREQEKEIEPFKEYTPFWQIEEGLSLYYSTDQNIEVQYYNQSNQKEMLNFRQLAAKLLREDLENLRENITFKKTSVFINFDLFQFVYLTALLFRSFNGEYLKNSNFSDAFLIIYDEHFSKKISQIYPSHLLQVLKEEVHIVDLLKSNISKLQNIDKSLMQIMKTWMPLILDDCSKILQNKFICLETLLRLEESFKSNTQGKEIHWSDQIMEPEKKMKVKKTKEEKEKDRTLLKIIKKIQYLLCFASEIYFREPSFPQTEGIDPIRTIDNKLILKNLLNRQSSSKQLPQKH